MTKKFYWGKIISLALLVMAVAATFSCCTTANTEISQPTSVVPTPNATATVGKTAKPTSTPDSGTEIHFSDVSLEDVVRDVLGKNIGPIMISDVENIKSLTARVRGISNIDALAYFTSLEELDLYGNRVTDLAPLSGLMSLKKLNLGKNFNVMSAGGSAATGMDISYIRELVLLEELDLSDNMITNVESLKTLTSLKKLVLSKNRLSDIAALSECRALEYIDISYNYGLNTDNTERGIKDLSPLYDIATIQTLIAGNNIVENIAGIEKLENVSYVELSYNFISDVAPLNALKNVKTVNLHCNSLMDINGFKDNETIETLDVSQNMITHFDVILSMKSLKKLNWEQNNIQDYEPIYEFEEKVK